MTRIARLVVYLLVLGGLTPALLTAASPLEVVLVQYEVSAEDYSSLEQFHDRIAHIVEEAMERSHPDLIVFPEYASVFALFTDYIDSRGLVRLDGIAPEVVELMSSEADDPAPAAAPAAATESAPESATESATEAATEAAHQLVRRQAERYSARIAEIWSEVAAEYAVWIIAGSGFVPAPEGGVNNRVWVYDRSGEIAYHQDKVFLTDFERENLGVVPGTVSEASTFEVDRIELAVTICRDSYFDAWEEGFSAADAWIDVRANGEEYSQAVRRRFDTALPERVAETPVPIGMSTSLNGVFLDLLWQGPAFVVDDDGNRIAQAPTVDGNYLMEVVVPDRAPAVTSEPAITREVPVSSQARTSAENSVD